jgi:hypothetical protein
LGGAQVKKRLVVLTEKFLRTARRAVKREKGRKTGQKEQLMLPSPLKSPQNSFPMIGRGLKVKKYEKKRKKPFHRPFPWFT